MNYLIIEFFDGYRRLEAKQKRFIHLLGVAILLCLLYLFLFVLGLFTNASNLFAGVEGRVSYQGDPVSVGSIEFDPVEPEKSQSKNALIKNGKFSIPEDGGLRRAAVYRLVVRAFRGTGEYYENNAEAEIPPSEIQEQYLPEIYNAKTELVFTADDESLSGDLILDLK